VEVADCELESLAAADVKQLEADCFWCFSKLLDGIQDNYTFAQPGIQKRVNSLKELVSRIDSKYICRCHSGYFWSLKWPTFSGVIYALLISAWICSIKDNFSLNHTPRSGTCFPLCTVGHCGYCSHEYLGRLLRVILIKWVSNVRPLVRPSVRPQNVFSISMKFGV